MIFTPRDTNPETAPEIIDAIIKYVTCIIVIRALLYSVLLSEDSNHRADVLCLVERTDHLFFLDINACSFYNHNETVYHNHSITHYNKLCFV